MPKAFPAEEQATLSARMAQQTSQQHRLDTAAVVDENDLPGGSLAGDRWPRDGDFTGRAGLIPRP
jgi:hypothetical protein